jgi:hypothetical protein
MDNWLSILIIRQIYRKLFATNHEGMRFFENQAGEALLNKKETPAYQ